MKILVAINGSDSCSKVAQKAQEMALLCKGEVTFLTILTPEQKLITSLEEYNKENELMEKRKQATKKALETCSMVYGQCELTLGKQGLQTKRIVKEGNYPAQDICQYAKENEFDLIVVADKENSSMKNILLGSTTEKIVRHSKISVLVVK
ncbi:nucleotide-binding universal stress UspA family protein [Orenia metallireducens]|uniref:Nucleotide-binding universal stress protein, UspA family n=1 Tax=Orenia metallireducens TaxID=1413210 RepID=A0A285I390_9FIRM|nr:universal stress protein [Orenia metallireducens]PRX23120.1 nucleotide-binding universal stress UspA family protein [Orenia metallireducens]SNY42418.1 Nucleotide-binding universal stress protein, UspA family [Orenia metallireducens]